MTHGDASIGMVFICGGTRWIVTDIGRRTVIAIPAVNGWVNGPPYAVPEMVFDEYDLPACEREQV